jgi:hypothetical protein
MSGYKPNFPYNVPVYLLIPTEETVSGVLVKKYPEKYTDGKLIFCSFRSFGGTETTVNGVYSVVDTATLETWYRPDIKSGCRFALAQTGKLYEITGAPENINMRNQFINCKVQAVTGGA